MLEEQRRLFSALEHLSETQRIDLEKMAKDIALEADHKVC